MAILTQRVASFEDEAIALSFDWDDATGIVVLGRCVNTSSRFGVHVIIQGTGTGAGARSWEATYPADSGTNAVSIPPGQQPQFPVVNGEVTGWRMRAEVLV